MKKNSISKFLLYIAVATFLTIMIVIAQKSYNNLMGPIKTAQGSSLARPINPNLNTELIDKIEAKKEYDETQIASVSPVVELTSTPTPTPTP